MNCAMNKNDLRIATVRKQSMWNFHFVITMNASTYLLKSDWTYRQVDIIKNNEVIGKISRRVKWFSTSFGIALDDDSDHIVFLVATILQHNLKKAQMSG